MSIDVEQHETSRAARLLDNFQTFRAKAIKRISDPTGRKREIRNLNLRLDLTRGDNQELVSELLKTKGRLEQVQGFSDQLSTELMIQELAANTDELTGAHNRKSFNHFLENVGKEVADRGFTGKGCVVAIDLDRFKQVNDTYGHHAGDEVLKAVVQRLQSVNLVSAETKVYRLGGDEFVLVVLDKRHDHDRRHDGLDELDITDGRTRGPDRRQMSFEVYVKQAIHDAITQAASKTVCVKLQNGKEVEVDFGISEGIGHFHSVTKTAMSNALQEADSEAYVRKSGLDDFLSAYVKMDDKTRKFVDDILGFRSDENARGGFVVDSDIGFSVLAQMEEFQSFIGAMNDRSMRWVFPEFNTLRAQYSTELGR